MSVHRPQREDLSPQVTHIPFYRTVVLVVDDDYQIRKLIRTILEKAGYEVRTAGSSPEALEFSRRYAGTIHLLCSDVEMTGVGGMELARLLIAQRPGTQVLMNSADPFHKQLGEFPFIEKPFTPEELRTAVASATQPRLDKKALGASASGRAPSDPS